MASPGPWRSFINRSVKLAVTNTNRGMRHITYCTRKQAAHEAFTGMLALALV